MPARRLRPVHPGDILKHDFLTPLGLTAYRVAKDIGVSLPTVNDIVRRRRAVTAEMALRFARYFGTSAHLWQNLQAQYDLEVASLKIGASVERRIRPFAKPEGAEPARRRAAA
jgi:addiction module HigA family antidote